MGAARRLIAAIALLGLVSAGCDAVSSASPAATWHTSPPSLAPFPTADVLRPDPNAPIISPRDARAPAVLAGTTHLIDLVVEERYNTLAEGFVRQVWTFGGTVPGPVIRVRQGDAIRVLLDNHPPRLPGRGAWMHPAVNDHPHSVDIRTGAADAPDGVISIKPGETKVYEFAAEHAGVWLYRCATEPVLEHVANGEYGMLIVEPEGGLEDVDQEFFLVQGEWYVGHQLGSSPPAKVASGIPDFVALNGVANQYTKHPIGVETGKRVRLYLLNAGPNRGSSFQVLGAAFDRVIRNDITPEVGTTPGWGVQPITLAPGQGAIVELTLAEDGLYPIIGHAPDLVARGALGVLEAESGDPRP